MPPKPMSKEVQTRFEILTLSSEFRVLADDLLKLNSDFKDGLITYSVAKERFDLLKQIAHNKTI